MAESGILLAWNVDGILMVYVDVLTCTTYQWNNLLYSNRSSFFNSNNNK